MALLALLIAATCNGVHCRSGVVMCTMSGKRSSIAIADLYCHTQNIHEKEITFIAVGAE